LNPVCRQALEKLLQQAQKAWSRGSTERKIALRFSEASMPAYLRLSSHTERLCCNADLQLAARSGAISVEWDVRAGERRQIERITLLDSNKLAQQLDVVPLWTEIDNAARNLEQSFERFPVLRQVLARWSRSAQARGTTARQYQDWLDAARVVACCLDSGSVDLPIRRISTTFFSDSKRVERLWPLMDVLLQGDASTPARTDEEVFGQLGLVKFPPTLLLAGTGIVRSGERRTALVPPYLGFAPGSIVAVSGIERTKTLLSVENLTTFHELAELIKDDDGHLAIYTGGMPSPSWLRVYTILLQALPARANVLHFGDIDAGGFRIAEYIAKTVQRQSRQLYLHGMDGGLLQEQQDKPIARRTLNVSEVSAIVRTCERWNWTREQVWVSTHGLAIEQESMTPLLPSHGSRDSMLDVVI
jgi:hypothetical protein